MDKRTYQVDLYGLCEGQKREFCEGLEWVQESAGLTLERFKLIRMAMDCNLMIYDKVLAFVYLGGKITLAIEATKNHLKVMRMSINCTAGTYVRSYPGEEVYPYAE